MGCRQAKPGSAWLLCPQPCRRVPAARSVPREGHGDQTGTAAPGPAAALRREVKGTQRATCSHAAELILGPFTSPPSTMLARCSDAAQRTNKAAFSQRFQSPGFPRQIPTLRVSARQTPASPRAGGGRREALPDPSQPHGGGQRCLAQRGTAEHLAEWHSGEEKENQRGSACFASPAAAPQPPARPHSDGPRGKGRAELAKEPRVPSSPDPAARVPPRGTSPQGRVTRPPARPPAPRPGNGGLPPPQSTEPQWHPRYRGGN